MRLPNAGEGPAKAGEPALARAAEPAQRTLVDPVDGQPIGVMLTDASGLLVYRLSGDQDLERHLDSILFASGLGEAENAAGPHGGGPALGSAGRLHVLGHEHSAAGPGSMVCAGVPVLDPVTGKTIGVVDLTSWRNQAGPLMLATARSAALHASRPAATAGGDRDLRLLHEYTRVCRQRGGIVLALGHDVVMLNDHARQALSPEDQAMLIWHATEMLERHSPGAVTVELPSGTLARMFCHPVGEADASGTSPRSRPGRWGWTSRGSRQGARGQDSQQGADEGAMDGVVHVKVLAPASTATAVPQPRPPMTLPGLVGGGAVWRRACRQTEAASHRGEWLAVEGESGVGKLAVIRAVHQRHHPAAPFHVLDAADGGDDLLAKARGELADGAGMLVLRHVHALDASQAGALAGALREAKAAGRDSALRVAVTLDRTAAEISTAADLEGATRADLTDSDVPNGCGDLLRLFPAVVAVPPLRHHSEDLRELVPFFLGRLRTQGQVSCSPAAMQLLVRYAWPGNAAQLWQVLKLAVQRRRVGQIMPDDLPSEVWTVSRRMLSPLESLERDAIVQSLFDHSGSKIRAARALGMSRATIYRRIREYGIVT